MPCKSFLLFITICLRYLCVCIRWFLKCHAARTVLCQSGWYNLISLVIIIKSLKMYLFNNH